MILTLALGLAMTITPQDAKGLVCPMTAEIVSTPAAVIDFAGARYEMCCGGCPDGFKKDPATALKSDKLKGKTVGLFLFDPVSNKRIDAKDAKGGTSDYKGLRYFFASADEKTAFDAKPKSFVAKTTKECMTCPVAGGAIKSYAVAGGYVDIEGTRYYTCCADCLAALKKDPSKFTAKAAANVKAPVAMDAPK